MLKHSDNRNVKNETKFAISKNLFHKIEENKKRAGEGFWKTRIKISYINISQVPIEMSGCNDNIN